MLYFSHGCTNLSQTFSFCVIIHTTYSVYRKRTAATGLFSYSFCLSVHPIVTTVYFGKTADSIKMPFWVGGSGGPKEWRIIWGPYSHKKRHFWGECGVVVGIKVRKGLQHSGDAAFNEITLRFYVYLFTTKTTQYLSTFRLLSDVIVKTNFL